MIKLFDLIFRLAGDVYTQLFKCAAVGHGEDDRGMRLAILQLV